MVERRRDGGGECSLMTRRVEITEGELIVGKIIEGDSAVCQHSHFLASSYSVDRRQILMV